jgi:energy-coupling factor transport system permease protein
MLDDLTLGRFEPGQSLFHRFDVRLKLVLLPVLVVSSFATAQLQALLLLTVLALAFAALSRLPWRLWWRGLLVFRWLFLFTLLLHLIFSPGRTLFGFRYLSYDGLLSGMVVIWQLCLAVIFSSLLTLTAPPTELARAFTHLAKPFKWLHLPVARAGEFLLLTLYFLPLLREELAVTRGAAAMQPQDVASRMRHLRTHLSDLLLRLADRGEELAFRMASGETLETLGLKGDPPCSAPPLTFWQNGMIFSMGLLICLLLLGMRLWPIFV